ncbi:UDP-N-acetylmuramoyl-L-alanine--D-glutamate ligase [Ruminococcaceae bacterium OttesenSCG-928-D13]|nr:UDP-N-acetylmuramoyl-L-alanine--D-glutamate ligase [Ruminococcaceae bacterium OttesenSCG-928-D13]
MGNFFKTLRGRKVAFIGAGVNHRELIPLFAKAGAVVTLCDAKTREALGETAAELEKLGVTLSLGEGYLDGLSGQQMILRTPGFEFFTPELQAAGKAGALVTSEMELFFEHCPCPITGITGSDGKTTTTTLIAKMHEAAGRTVHLGGNLGRPLLPIVDTISKTDLAVVELSSFQLISMKRSPGTALVTNITPNHLDHHKDMQEYIDAKRNILLHQGTDDLTVLGHANDLSRGLGVDVNGRIRWFSRLPPWSKPDGPPWDRAATPGGNGKPADGAFLTRDGMLCHIEDGVVSEIISQSEIKLPGLHNIENLLAAIATVWGTVPIGAIRAVAASFTGVEHRLEPVRVLNGVRWINDSIATSPTRVMAGLRAFDGNMILLAGGYDKNLDYAPMVPLVLEKVKLLILMAPTASKIEAAVRADPGFAASALEIRQVENLDEAVRLARRKAVAGDIVSLSPASAAFDAYPNFEHRGRHFKELVRAL